MLQELAVPSGAFILQSAAGSTLGRMLITVAKHRGIKTINLVRRAEQIPELLAAGADHVICTSEDVGARVQEITGGKGAWGAVDAVGGELTAVITGALRPGGTVLVYGAMSGMVFTGSIVDVLFRGVSIKGFWLTPYLESLSADAKKAVFSEIVTMFAEGLLVPFSGQKFQLSDVKKAVAHAQEPARGGKALLVSS
jgi:NADPH:quinone reductase-like Zn-dependent oxidoreductase